MNVYGYVRVSTRSQNYDEQVEQIKKYCRFKDYNLVFVYEDKVSGKTMNRSGYQDMISVLETNPQQIGVIVATKLDRIGRTLLDLINFSMWCKEKKIDLVFTQSNIDTTTPEGRMFFYNMGAFAEYERERIAERTSEGRARYIKSGGKLGRHEKQVNIDLAKHMIAEGVPKAEIARRLKIDRSTLYKRLEEKE
jgi:DNA invertase Pin-like site-specific DNA recombinase